MSGLAPNPMFPESVSTVYERKIVTGVPGEEGPNRFQEGLGTDTDVPNEFTVGIMQGLQSAPGRPNRNANVFEKYPEETMRQRAHMGSAAWVEAEDFLSEFAAGAFTDFGDLRYEEVITNGGLQRRPNPVVVTD